MTDPIQQSVLFPSLLDKPAYIFFDEPKMTSDGGALLLKAVDDRLGLSARLAGVLADPRDSSKVRHSIADLLRQRRVYPITIGLLRGTIGRLRQMFPEATIRVRLDGGFAGSQMLAFLEQQGVAYLVAMGKNAVPARRCARLMGTARRLSHECGHSVGLFGQTRYAARSWKKIRRRGIYKAEVTRYLDREPRDNPRFVVTTYVRGCARLGEEMRRAVADRVRQETRHLEHGSVGIGPQRVDGKGMNS